MPKYEPVIGIETHVQLKTRSKLFCGCDNDSREAEPNTHVCPVCLGLPGTLPVLNQRAVELALLAGLALNGEIPKETKFDRKNYFYPDLPKGYQITQFDKPIIGRGEVEVPLGGKTFKVGITRAHMEEDAGKLVHPEGADYSLVDLNRAGTPLLEIVSEPDMRSAVQAKAYAQEIYNLVRYANVSDANLYYGNMRFDVNISLRPEGREEFGTRAEIKNLNSFRAVEKAVEYEIERQAELLDEGHKIAQETRGFDDASGKTYSQRSKEEAHDYRYFPEPDLPPLVIVPEMIKIAKNNLPVMPNEIRAKAKNLGVPDANTEIMISEKDLGILFLAVADDYPAYAVRISSWLVGHILQAIHERGADNVQLNHKQLVQVAKMVEEGKLSSSATKEVLSQLFVSRLANPEEIALKFGLIQVSDSGELEQIVSDVLKANPKPVEDFKAGQKQAIGFLVGQVMKASKGKANPAMVNDIMRKQLGD